MKLAIDGLAKSDFHMGSDANSDGQKVQRGTSTYLNPTNRWRTGGMPRKRPKTEADRPTYRASSTPPLAVPDQLQPFLAGMEIQRAVQKYGVANVQLVLGVIAALARRELIDERRREILDAWKSKMRLLVSATAPQLPSLQTSDARRRQRRYRRHREAEMDSTIRQQTRARELEDGLAILLESGADAWYRRQLDEIVERAKAGETATQIGRELRVSTRTIERRLSEIRNAALGAAERPTSTCPISGQDGGRGTNIPLSI